MGKDGLDTQLGDSVQKLHEAARLEAEQIMKHTEAVFKEMETLKSHQNSHEASVKEKLDEINKRIEEDVKSLKELEKIKKCTEHSKKGEFNIFMKFFPIVNCISNLL